MPLSEIIISCPDHVQDRGQNEGQQSPEVGQDLADVVAAAAEHGKDGVAERAFQRAARQASVCLHMSDLGLDGAASPEQRFQLRRQAAAGAADQDLRFRHPMAAIPAVHDGQLRGPASQDGHLLQGFGQSVAIVRISRKARIPTTKPSSMVVARLTLVPNS